MFRNTAICLGIAGWVLACAGADPGASEGGASSDSSDAAELSGTGQDPQAAPPMPAPEPPPPFSTPLETLVQNSVQWSALRVDLLAARLTRGEGDRSPWDTYAEVDLRIENQGDELVDFQTRNTWDLILADGTRKMSSNSLGVLIARGDAPSTTLYYKVDDNTDLHGAVLQLNGEDRQLEPFDLPLESTVASDPLLQLDDLTGQIIDNGDLTFEVASATIGRNDVVGGGRAMAHRNILRLDLIVTNPDGIDLYLNLAKLLLVIDGNSYQPATADSAPINPGVSVQMAALYSVPDTVTAFDVLFPAYKDNQPRVSVDTANSTAVPQ